MRGDLEERSEMEEQLEIQWEILEARENHRKDEVQHLSKNYAKFLVDCCIRVLQRDRINRICTELAVHNCTQLELAHIIMEAKKSHGLQSRSWRTRKAGGVIQSGSRGLRIRGLMV